MKNIGTVQIETERLVLRRLKMADADSLWALGSLVGTPDEVRKMVSDMMVEYERPFCFHWAISYENRAIGRIRAWEVDPFNSRCQLGYDIALEYRDRGLMTEALCAVLQYLFDEADFHRVYCQIRSGNLASVRVCEKCGLAFEGTMKGHYKGREGYEDVRLYGIVRE